MVERVAIVFFDNGSLSVQGENFESGAESIHEDSEEQNSTSLEKGAAGVYIIVDVTD